MAKQPSAKTSRRINGPAVKVIREETRRMKQDECAQLAGIHPSMLSRIEKGTVYASLETMCRIAGALRVDLDVISYPVHTVYVTDSEPAA